jgi:hypothetical protein
MVPLPQRDTPGANNTITGTDFSEADLRAAELRVQRILEEAAPRLQEEARLRALEKARLKALEDAKLQNRILRTLRTTWEKIASAIGSLEKDLDKAINPPSPDRIEAPNQAK